MPDLRSILGAVYRKEIAVLKKLSRAEANLRDEDGRTPLMHAVLAEDADPTIVELLASRGADIDAVDQDQKWSALHFAARDQKQDVVAALSAAGASVDIVNAAGNTPLLECMLAATPSPLVVRELLSHGADPFHRNHDRESAIDVARRTKDADLLRLMEGRSQP